MTKHYSTLDSHAQAEDYSPEMRPTGDSQHAQVALQLEASPDLNEARPEVFKKTNSSTGDAKAVLVIIEPHAALFRYLEVAQRNYRTLVLSSNPDTCLRGELKYNDSMGRSDTSHIDEIVKCDTGRSESMLEALMPFQQQIEGVVAGEDSFVPVAAELGAALGFDYTHPSDAVCLHLKTAMKQRFAERGVRSPRFAVAQTIEQSLAAWEEFNRNCMVKMVDSASSVNIYRVTTRRDLEEAWDTIVHNRKNIVTPIPLSQKVIIEEFVGGRELSAEGYIQDDQIVILNFCEKVTEINFIVVGHYLPADLSSREEEQVRSITEKCVRALGLQNSVFHVEVHIMHDVPYVIECAGRPPGQHMVELMRRCYGFDLMQISIDIATGKKVSVVPREAQRHFAMLALYSKKRGILRKIVGLDELHSKGGATHVHVDVKEGDQVQALSTFSDKCGFVILEDDSATGIREKAAWMKENVLLLVGD